VAKILQKAKYEIPQTYVEKIITETVGGEERTLRRFVYSQATTYLSLHG